MNAEQLPNGVTGENGLRYSPLNAEHFAAGASFTDFAGWSMPVRYQSDLAEHLAVRQSAGLFDVSHMAEFQISGPDAAAYLDFALSSLISRISDGQAKYSLILTESGGIVDDVIVYRVDDEQFLVVANAGNRFQAFDALRDRTAGFKVDLVDLSDELALLALQGPNAAKILDATTGFETLSLDELKYYRYQAATFRGVEVHLARTGYTGEDGFELMLPNHQARELWAALLEAGEPYDLVPAGLAARDSLRLEAGFPLYGHELGLDIKPAQAALSRVVVMSKDTFVGKSALEENDGSQEKVLVGLRAEGRRAPRAGYLVFSADEGSDAPIGEISSGALSPSLGYPIAFAFVEPRYSEIGTELRVDIRGTGLPATVVELPFYRRTT
ncbi:MAG: glycine cleavage system aminomethyltransferase GcvT [Microbacteriaceae bacterium]